MVNKVQGEGDYESARRYNKHTKESVQKGAAKIPVRDSGADERELRNAEQSGKARAKEMQHDKTDADLMKQPVDRKSTQ